MPASPPIFLAIDQAMRAGDMALATNLARQALDQGHVHPVPLSLRAWWHENENRPADALADLRQVQAMAGDSMTLTAIGRCLTVLGRSEEALPNLVGAIALDPTNARAWFDKGMAHEQLGELAEARTAYEQAARLAPQMTDATARLAGLAARRSDWPAARAKADQALAAEPDHAIAHFAHLMADLAARDFAAAEQRARRIAQSPRSLPQPRAIAWSYLGDALDGQGRAAEAFTAYAEANKTLQLFFAGRFENNETGLPLAQRVVSLLAQTSPSDWQEAERQAEPPTPSPVFLMGFARAGTSLLGQILAGHPRLAVLEEKPLFGTALDEFFIAPGGLERLQALSPAEAARHRALFWTHARQEAGSLDGRRVVDQTPLNVLHLPLIARLFPGATILFALRDPRDVVLSCFRRLFVLNRYTYEFLSLPRTAEFYDAAMQLQALARDKLPLAFHDIRNEDLVADFKGSTQSLCAALELEWDPAMGAFAERSKQGAVATPSATQIARGLSGDGIGQWRRYRDQMKAVMPLLTPWAQKFGYDP